MENDRSAKIIASIGTVAVATLVVLLLTLIYLSVPAQEAKPPRSEIMLMEEEEFVEVVQEPTYTPQIPAHEDTSSYLPEPEHNESQPTPASGTDMVDNAPKKDTPPPVVSSKEPSPVKVKTEKPKDQGSTVDKKKQEEEQIKRQATNEVANAFKNASGKNNALTSSNDKGKSGENTVAKGSQGTTGFGSGSVGGGWIIPKYAPVKSTVTGSVNIVVKIDKTGKVISLSFNGGTPPAATDTQVRAAIEREIRSRKFSRSNYDDAESATAYITYTFK